MGLLFRFNAIAALLAFGTTELSSAANYNVGPTRSIKQIQEVTARLNAGDTVLVDGGSTYAGGIVFTRPGAAGKPIVILGLAAGGNRPIVSGGVNTVHFRSDDPFKIGADHYVFQGFEVTGGTSRGIFHQAGDLVIRDVIVRDCLRHGILGGDQGSGSLTLEYSEVHSCGGGDRDHQIYMATDQVNRPGSVFRMQHCYVHDAKGGNNVKSRSERNEIYYNWIEGAFYHELELIGPDPEGVADGWTAHLKREDSDVLGNVFWKRRTAAANDSNFAVFRIGGDATGESHGRYRFVNNTIIAGTGAVFRCFDSLESVEMHNNVFHRPGGSLNMMRISDAAWTQGKPILAGSNNWITVGAANVPAEWAGTKQGADPAFVSFAGRDLRPDPSSPLVNMAAAAVPGPTGFAFPNPLFPPSFVPPVRVKAGTSAARPAREALDIGAYEEGTPGAAVRNPRPATGPMRSAWVRSAGTLLFPYGAGENLEMRTLEGREAR